MKNEIKIFCSEDWKDYELLDTGGGEKLERFGKYTFVRPCEDAVWPKCATSDVAQKWSKADGKFWSSRAGARAGWKFSKDGPWGNSLKDRPFKWEMEYKGIKFLASPTPFRHLGFFPEQASHWDFIEGKIKEALTQLTPSDFSSLRPSSGASGSKRDPREQKIERGSAEKKIKFLNLFGYTGVASLFALRAGAEVTHLDASKQTLNWAKENEALNSDQFEEGQSLRIIEDDAIKFLEREVKRGNKYDAIIMDPPKFGRGPKGEVWKIEEMLPKLLSLVQKVLSEKPLFVILTSYAIDSSSLSLGYALEETMKNLGGKTEVGELCVLEKSNGRIIPLANTAMWSSK